MRGQQEGNGSRGMFRYGSLNFYVAMKVSCANMKKTLPSSSIVSDKYIFGSMNNGLAHKIVWFK